MVSFWDAAGIFFQFIWNVLLVNLAKSECNFWHFLDLLVILCRKMNCSLKLPLNWISMKSWRCAFRNLTFFFTVIGFFKPFDCQFKYCCFSKNFQFLQNSHDTFCVKTSFILQTRFVSCSEIVLRILLIKTKWN